MPQTKQEYLDHIRDGAYRSSAGVWGSDYHNHRGFAAFNLRTDMQLAKSAWGCAQRIVKGIDSRRYLPIRDPRVDELIYACHEKTSSKPQCRDGGGADTECRNVYFGHVTRLVREYHPTFSV